jgi:Zn-dependent peptidase ImmA (M78 family)
MSSFYCLDTTIKTRLTNLADQILKEVSIEEPPVNLDQLYESEKLLTTMLEKTNSELVALEKELKITNIDILRGVIFIPEKRVVVISQDYQKRNNFTLAHEFGHWKIPWHRDLLYKCTQFDLSPKARFQMEREANYFASEISFMGDLFLKQLLSSPLSMRNIKALSDIFGMSIEATLIRAVELELRPCALLSLIVNEKDPDNFLSIRYAIYSQSFKEQVDKEFNLRQTFPQNHELAKIITDSVPSLINSHQFIGRLGKEKERVNLKTEVWKNKWNIFALFQP